MEDLKKPKLTVRTSIGLQSESNPTIRIPVQWDQADVASDHQVLELMLDHTVCVTVTWKSLEKHINSSKLVFCLSIHASFSCSRTTMIAVKFPPLDLYCSQTIY